MEDKQLIDYVLRQREVFITIPGPWRQKTQLAISIPDLRDAPRRVSGDWGPMYTVSIPPGHPVELAVSAGSDEGQSVERLDIARLQVDSPMLASERRETPLVMKLPVVEQDGLLQLFFDATGTVVRAELHKLSGTASVQLELMDCRPLPRSERPANAAYAGGSGAIEGAHPSLLGAERGVE